MRLSVYLGPIQLVSWPLGLNFRYWDLVVDFAPLESIFLDVWRLIFGTYRLKNGHFKAYF